MSQQKLAKLLPSLTRAATLLLGSLLITTRAQLCEVLHEESWQGLEEIIELSFDFAILCPFHISGDGCPSKSYKVTVPNLYLLCEPLLVGNQIKGCVIDCPGLQFDVQNKGALTLDGMTLKGATRSAVRVKSRGTLTTINSIFESNHNDLGNGGAIDARVDSVVSIINTKFQDNKGLNGGAIYHLGEAAVSGSEFYNNEATNGGGGAIFSGSNSKTSLRRCTFAGNKAIYYGPAVFDGTDTMTSSDKNSGCGNTFSGSSTGCNGVSSLQNGAAICSEFDDLCIPPTSSPTGPPLGPSILPSTRSTRLPTTPPSSPPATHPTETPTVVPTRKPSSNLTPTPSITGRPTLSPTPSPTMKIPTLTPHLSIGIRTEDEDGPPINFVTSKTITSSQPSLLRTSRPTRSPIVRKKKGGMNMRAGD